MAKRTKNWTEIEARYIAGEKPRDIANDYKNCDRSQISQQAHKKNWKKEKEINRQRVIETLSDQVVENVLLTRERWLQELCTIAYVNVQDYVKYDPDTCKFRVKDILELSPEASRAIKQIKQNPMSLELMYHDKLGALKMLGEVQGFNKAIEDEATSNAFTLNINKPADLDEGK